MVSMLLVDATLIKSSRRPQKTIKTNEVNGVYQIDDHDAIIYLDDTEAKWTFKAGKYTYGYSSVVTTDANGLVNKATTHPANTSEMTAFEDNIKKANIHKGTRVLYDKGAG